MAHWNARVWGAAIAIVIGATAASRTRAADLDSPVSSTGDSTSGQAAGDESPVWHPSHSGCFVQVLGDSATNWREATPRHERAMSASSLRFWSQQEYDSEVVVFDSGGSPRLSPAKQPYIVVASGSVAKTCVERLPPDACPEAAEVRSALLEHRLRIGEGVGDGGLTSLYLHARSYSVEVADQHGVDNRWSFLPKHVDFPLMAQRFKRMDRCFARVRAAMKRWQAAPEAAPPAL
jgi:hypothetical protein